MTHDDSGQATVWTENPPPALHRELSHLVASNVIKALAMTEGVDLAVLRLPFAQRPRYRQPGLTKKALRMLDWPGDSYSAFHRPEAARTFFENFELYPGLVVRNWGHPDGRLAFGLEGNCVTFELHVPSAGLLISGTPEAVHIALSDILPEAVCVSLIGEPLERLVAWPPASGPDYVVRSIESYSGAQLVTLSTTPVTVSIA